MVMDSMQWILFHGLEQRLAVFLVAEYDRYGKRIYTFLTNILHGTSEQAVSE